MSKIVHYQFMGSWLVFWFFCITGIGIPIALLYLINGTIRTDSEVDDPEQFIVDFRAGKLSVKH